MSIEDDFITAIQADPNNQEMRKVYADWLQDQGRVDDAMYVLFYPFKASMKFRFRVNGVKEVRCSICNNMMVHIQGYNYPTQQRSITQPSYCPSSSCPKNGNFIYLKLQEGHTYKYNGSTFQWWNGIDDKWWERIE